jgi:hypothetical protein
MKAHNFTHAFLLNLANERAPVWSMLELEIKSSDLQTKS